MAKDSSKKAEDLELTADKAGGVKGGAFPPEPGGGAPRQFAVKKRKLHKASVPKGPIRGMPHE